MKPIFEKIPIGQAQTIVAFQYAKKDFETPWHFHPQHELTFIEESVGTKFIGDYVGPYEPGELVLLRSNLPHCWKNKIKEEGLARSIVVQWNKGIFSKIPELQPIFDLLKTAAKGILFKSEETIEILQRLRHLSSLSGSDLYVEFLAILFQLTKVNFQTLSKASFTDDLPTTYNTRMMKIHEFVGNNYHRKIYLKELAKLLNLTEQSFARFFKKMMGRSFFTFLNEYRINMVSRMLIDTDWSVGEIGYACGFESLPFYYKQFKKFKGISPARFRKKYHPYHPPLKSKNKL